MNYTYHLLISFEFKGILIPRSDHIRRKCGWLETLSDIYIDLRSYPVLLRVKRLFTRLIIEEYHMQV